MIRKRIVIHAGLPKTGTSALQELLFSSMELLRKNGILYPDTVDSRNVPYHRFFIRELRDNGAMPQYRAIVKTAEKNDIHTIVISIEGITAHIDSIRANVSKVLQDICTHWDIQIVSVLRAPEPWLLSMYKQCIINQPVKRNASLLETQYATNLTHREFSKREDVRSICDRNVITKRLVEIFPKAELVFLEYGENIISAFIELIAATNIVSANKAAFINMSLPAAYLEIIRRMNGVSNLTASKKIVKEVISKIVDHNNVQISNYDGATSKTILERILALYLAVRLTLISYEANPPIMTDSKVFGQTKNRVREGLLAFSTG
jgi:hypothetical protein